MFRKTAFSVIRPRSFVTLLLCRAGKIDALSSRGLGFAPLVPAICAIAHAFDQDRPVWTELASLFDRLFLRRENVVCFRVPLPPNHILSVRTVLDKNRSERPPSRPGQAKLFAELFERRDRSRYSYRGRHHPYFRPGASSKRSKNSGVAIGEACSACWARVAGRVGRKRRKPPVVEAAATNFAAAGGVA